MEYLQLKHPSFQEESRLMQGQSNLQDDHGSFCSPGLIGKVAQIIHFDRSSLHKIDRVTVLVEDFHIEGGRVWFSFFGQLTVEKTHAKI